jgi:hypothetical protein
MTRETRLSRDKRIAARVLAHAHTAINLLQQWAGRTVADEPETVDLIARSRDCAAELGRDLNPDKE